MIPIQMIFTRNWQERLDASCLTPPLQTQPDWKQQFGAKKEDRNGAEAIFR